MKYAFEDMSDDQFERLVVLLCQRLLGMGVQGFSKGKDGGRDARFDGTAQLLPSTSSPWKGLTVVQAKHTNSYNKHFLESDFFSSTSNNTVLGEEIARIRTLRDAGQLDNYLLFANRRLAGNAHAKVLNHIATECGIPTTSIYLCGIEQLDLWLRQFPDIPDLASLDPVDSPLIIGPEELALVVEALAENKDVISQVFDDPPSPRVSYETKNKLNNMSESYAKAQQKKYLKETKQIQSFLAAPENVKLLHTYESVADEFNFKIIASRKSYQSFDQVMEYLVDLLFGRDPILRQHKRVTRTLLFYMYWHCDIGVTE